MRVVTKDSDVDLYIQKRAELKTLTEEVDTLKGKIKSKYEPNTVIFSGGTRYVWKSYVSKRVSSWKNLFTYAYSLLDDSGQVLASEKERTLTKNTTSYQLTEEVE